MGEGLFTGEDGLERCWWGVRPEIYARYHDTEWGVPVVDEVRLFEKICLEGFQSGLSWLTILNKRENFRAAFDGFDFEKVAEYGAADVERLLRDAGIVRHRKKITSTINNAARARELRDEFGSLAIYFWRWEPAPEERPARMDQETLRAISTTREATALSRDLRRRGWSFIGPTTAYAFMQAMAYLQHRLHHR